MKSNYAMDPRWFLTTISMVPFLFLLAGISSAIITWHSKSLFSNVMVILLFGLSYFTGRQIHKISDYLGKKLIRIPNRIVPGKYLFFNMEKPETFDKFKFISDDFGVMLWDSGRYLLVTSESIYTFGKNDITVGLVDIGKLAKGVRVNITSDPGISFIAQVIYNGDNLKVAASQSEKSKWAIEYIKNWANK
jgi:hypothetical protein